MLHMYICHKCMNFRIVSRNPSPICFHCGEYLYKTSLDYNTYTRMTQDERDKYKKNYKKTI